MTDDLENLRNLAADAPRAMVQQQLGIIDRLRALEEREP
jgi:hypothetical protein